MAKKQLPKIIDDLEELYGPPKPPKVTSPYEMIVYECVAYLVSDEKRDATYDDLAKRIGLGPVKILEAPLEVIMEVLKSGGIVAENRLEKLRKTALLYLQEFRGDFAATLQLPLAKSGRPRFIALNEPALMLLSRLPRSHDSPFIFPSPITGRPSPSLHFPWRRIRRNAGLPDELRLHDLRHTSASLMLSAGIHPKIVSERLGHSSIAITLDLYSHVIPGMQADAAEKLGVMILG